MFPKICYLFLTFAFMFAVLCPPGSATYAFVSPGIMTLRRSGICTLCRKNYYAMDFGQSKCNRCPFAMSTVSVGSDDSRQCSDNQVMIMNAIIQKYIGPDSSLSVILKWDRLSKTLVIGVLVLLPLGSLLLVILLHNAIVKGDIISKSLYEKQMELAELVIIMTCMDRQDMDLKKRKLLQEMIAAAELETAAVGEEEKAF